ncbi:MAG: putative glycoside hydrolase/deacetylase ChbG (UPF0249 family) [Cellvibrionaceae bacterium]|jgi:predicted glycoside hydrolase/deacetylase ChbG (UPF0249 family)
MVTNINPVLKQLGLAETDKAVVFHADDIGVLNASVTAWSDLAASSPMTAASVMTPCPWFPSAAIEIAKHKDADVGVHMTLNSEWNAMRWRPISTSDPASGLFDEEGYSPRDTESVQKNASSDAVAAELHAQMDRALAAGIDVTHIDTHMGALFHSRFLETYVRVGFAYQVPAFAIRADQETLIKRGYAKLEASQISSALKFIEAQGMPMFDSVTLLPLRDSQSLEERKIVGKEILESYGPGLHYFIFHPAVATPELQAVAPDWAARNADYELFMDDDWPKIIQEAGVIPVTCRQLRDVFRKNISERS